MTPLRPLVVSARPTLRDDALAGFKLLLAAFLLAIAGSLWADILMPPVIDARMETACKLPTGEGEATLFLVVDNELRCYRWR